MPRLLPRASVLAAVITSTLIFGTAPVAAASADEFNTPFHFYNDDDVWINDIGTLLYNDHDRDGYFSGISLSFDADTVYNNFDVFIAIDIINQTSLDNTFVERLHTTRSFSIYGRSITDEYHVDIDLLQNFLPASYDLRITLADAHSREILDQVNARDFRNLGALPLESEDNETVSGPDVIPINGTPDSQVPNDDIRVVESAGSGGPLIIALLFSGLLLRSRK